MPKEIKCSKCDEPAEFFHSKCCNAHFEGIIIKEGKLQFVCEKCGKFVGELKREYDKSTTKTPS